MKLAKIAIALGFLIIAISYFLPVAYGCDGIDENDEMTYYAVYGSESVSYYFSALLLVPISLLGFFGYGIAARVFWIILVVLGFLGNVFLEILTAAGWGKPCGQQASIFGGILYISHILIIISTGIMLFKRKNTKQRSLLDDF